MLFRISCGILYYNLSSISAVRRENLNSEKKKIRKNILKCRPDRWTPDRNRYYHLLKIARVKELNLQFLFLNDYFFFLFILSAYIYNCSIARSASSKNSKFYNLRTYQERILFKYSMCNHRTAPTDCDLQQQLLTCVRQKRIQIND